MKNRIAAGMVLFGAGRLAAAVAFTVGVDGKDANPGTEAQPFATLTRARDAVRELKARGPLPDGGVTVEVQGGSYQLDQPLELTEADSGTSNAPVVYRARKGEDVRLVGGRIVSGWTAVTDPAVLARLDESARAHVWQADLKALGVTDLGKMQSDSDWTSSSPGLELFFNDQPMTLARWPNAGTVRIGDLLVQDGHAIHGQKGSKVGTFTYEGDRPKRWAGEKDVMLHGYWFWDWADQRYRVESIDTAQRVITLPSKPPHAFGFRKGQWYYAFNLLCELDQPGEWYLDREIGMLYFWPPGAKPESGKAIVSVLPDLVKMKKASYVTLRGFTLEGCRGTAVTLSGGRDSQVLGCVIRNVGGSGVGASGLRHRVAGCDIYQTAKGGLSLTGGDRKTLTPGGLVAENNHIHHYSRWKPVYCAGIRLDGVGNHAAHNLIHDAPHMAIGFSGNDQVIECNEIHHVVTHSNDAGALYCGFNWSMRGNVIRHNYLHDITGYEGKGCVGVYLDDQFSSALIFGNIFYRVSSAAFIGGGHDTVIENNVFVECSPALHIDARGLGWQSDSTNRLMKTVQEMPYAEEPWKSRYPMLAGLLTDPDPLAPKGNVIARNIQWKGKWDGIEKKAQPYLVFVCNLLDLDPKFVDEKALDFRLRDDSPAFKVGFQKIPVEKIGLYPDECRASWPVVGEVIKR
jgi:hypothetical protein